MEVSNIYYIDLFCGAGGTTEGVHLAGGKVIACVNHDKNAIKSHALNHPDCLHYTEDIRNFDVVRKLKILVDELRKKEPGCTIVLWASLECTNYSKAKGGLPRDNDSRSLPYHMYMYIDALSPDVFYVENVKEFMSWGPLDKKGKPVSKLKGRDYIKWVNIIKNKGYNFDSRLLNAANYGAVQTRIRYFAQFAKSGYSISWPEPTHSKTGALDMFGKLEKWKPVSNVLDLHDYGESIFKRKKPLAENTLKRIYEGLEKFAIKDKSFTISYYGNGASHSLSKPCGTITTHDRYAYVNIHFLDNQYGKGNASSLLKPSGSILSNPKQSLITVQHQWLFNPQFNSSSKDENKFVINSDDSVMTKKIKEYMIQNNIGDILKRMLKIPELLKIQGFEEDYKLIGTVADKKKFIGNAVEVTISRALACSLIETIKTKKSLVRA